MNALPALRTRYLLDKRSIKIYRYYTLHKMKNGIHVFLSFRRNAVLAEVFWVTAYLTIHDESNHCMHFPFAAKIWLYCPVGRHHVTLQKYNRRHVSARYWPGNSAPHNLPLFDVKTAHPFDIKLSKNKKLLPYFTRAVLDFFYENSLVVLQVAQKATAKTYQLSIS